MKKEHWICGGAGCEAPLFRRSFWLDRTERFQSARLEICGLGYFLFYINGKRISDQELMPAMTDYASVLGCETTYPVWEERSAHRCRYLSFDLLPYLKAGKTYLQYDWAMAGIIRQSGLPKENLFSVCRSFGLN